MPSKPYEEGLVVSATELKQNFGKYMDLVEQQNDVVITKNGTKIARLTAYVTDIEQYFAVRERALDYQYGGKKVSYDEFMAIYEKSTLRMEFINGEIHLLDSPLISHQDILGRLYLCFQAYFVSNKCRVFFAPFDVHFFKQGFKEPDVMQPDLLVACDLEGNVSEKGKYMGTPTLVLEVLSASTRTKDMLDKLNTYTLSGVREYWMVDPKTEKVILYAFADRDIDDMQVFTRAEVAKSFFFEGLSVDCGQLFSDLL
jgi:prevent-host-death family protein